MAFYHHKSLLKNLAIVTGAASAIGFFSVPVLMHLASQRGAVGELIAGRAIAQTVQGSDSGSVEGGQTAGSQPIDSEPASATPQGSQPRQEQTIPPFGQSGNATQPLFPSPAGEASPSTPSSGQTLQNPPGVSTTGETGTDLDDGDEASGVGSSQTFSAPAGQSSTRTNGRSVQQSVPIGGSAPVTSGSGTRTAQPTTVISPGILRTQPAQTSVPQPAPVFAQGAQPAPAQSPVQSPAVTQPQTQTPIAQPSPAGTVGSPAADPTLDQTSTFDQTTTTEPQTTQQFPAQSDAQFGQAVRALW